MAYPEHLIHDGETVALDLNPHWWYFIQHIAVGTGILGLILIWNWLGNGFLHNSLGFVVGIDRKSTRLNSSHVSESRMPSSA